MLDNLSPSSVGNLEQVDDLDSVGEGASEDWDGPTANSAKCDWLSLL